MTNPRNVVAIDLGNSSGRLVLGQWDGAHGAAREIYRFPNAQQESGGHVVWDMERIWREIVHGLRIAGAEAGGEVASIGLDSWGAEYLLVDRAGDRIGPAYTLRDPRQLPAMQRAFSILPRRRIYEITGIQVMPINTLYGLLAHAEEAPREWEAARYWLGTPEYFLFRMTGVAVAEFTNALNSQMVDALSQCWSEEICSAFGFPLEKFPPIVPPGTILGSLRPEVAREAGLGDVKVIAPACHDTGSAVAAISEAHDELAFISSGTWSLVGTVLDRPLITDQSYQFNITNEGGVGGTIRFLRNVIGLWLLQEVLQQWSRQGIVVSASELAERCMEAPLEGPWFDLSYDEDLLAPGNMVERLNARLEAQGFPAGDRPAALAAAIFRSLARRYAEVVHSLRITTRKDIKCLCIVGGGVRNAALNRLAGMATGLEVVPGPSEATLLGNVAIQICALEGTRSLPDIQNVAARLSYIEASR